jgi:hypothetical protein
MRLYERPMVGSLVGRPTCRKDHALYVNAVNRNDFVGRSGLTPTERKP